VSRTDLEFKTEVKQLLDIVINSLYSHREVFLRELISNAADAIDRARFESLTNKHIMEGEGEWKIRIIPDRESGTLTVSDNGIGMSRDEIVEALGTIAHSGTRQFLQLLKDRKESVELIGQFGVGFYSAFMVAERVTVISRRAGERGTGVRWESRGDGYFTVEEIEKEKKGTDVILKLKEEDRRFLEEWEIREIVRRYSDYIEHPIVLVVEREKESEIKKGEKVKVKEEITINSQKAIWLKDRSKISKDEYNEFYRHISHDFTEPAKVIHFRAEGTTTEFTALLYIPSRMPLDIYLMNYKAGPMLYVKRVQIMDHCEALLPRYLRFVRGVVESSDLPLNISREMLQSNRQVEIINRNITKKILDTLKEMKEKEYDKYLEFYKEFGKVLKEGIHLDQSRREAICDLLLFNSTEKPQDQYVSLEEYVKNMKEDQDAIYYITATSYDEAKSSPYLEAIREKGYEVLIMLDEIDDFIVSDLEYRGKRFKSVIKGEISLDKDREREKKEAQKKYNALIELIKDQLRDVVKDVRISGRLRDTACCLVAEEGAPDPQTERILRALGQNIPEHKRILEINPDHPVFEAMNKLFEKDQKSVALREYIDLLYNQALILEGSRPKDPASFVRTVTRLMTNSLQSSSADQSHNRQ